jgi:ribosomal protein S18 acetylase RimI-like enzyme
LEAHVHSTRSSMDYSIVDPVVRRATASEAAQVSRLIGSTWAKFFAYSVSESDLETYLSTLLSEASIRAEIEDPSKYFLVAERRARLGPGWISNSDSGATEGQEGPMIVGVAQINLTTKKQGLITSNPVELNRLYIDPKEQGGGLAAILLDSAVHIAKEMRYDGLWLGVWENNARAKRFYEKMRFEERGEHYFWVGESKRRDLVMEKRL